MREELIFAVAVGQSSAATAGFTLTSYGSVIGERDRLGGSGDRRGCPVSVELQEVVSRRDEPPFG